MTPGEAILAIQVNIDSYTRVFGSEYEGVKMGREIREVIEELVTERNQWHECARDLAESGRASIGWEDLRETAMEKFNKLEEGK